jgi:hypothetical protein
METRIIEREGGFVAQFLSPIGPAWVDCWGAFVRREDALREIAAILKMDVEELKDGKEG